MIEHKILFTGTMGAGKTTAIQAVSEIPPVTTDVLNSDLTLGKEKTTVALDYGEVSLGRGERLKLYGTPGQERFSFMWKILAEGALGLVILIDHSRPDPLADLAVYLGNFKKLIRNTGCVIGISKMDGSKAPTLESFIDVLQQNDLVCPVIPVDVREKQQVLWVLDLLLTQLETRL